MDDISFQTLKAYYSCIHKWLVSLRGLLPAATSAEWKQEAALWHPLNVTERKTSKEISDLDLPLHVLHVLASMRPIHWAHGPAWWQHFYVEMRWPVWRFCFFSLWFFFNLTFLLPTLSAFHIPSTSGPCLCALCSANSSSWKSCSSSAATRVFSRRCG